LGSTEVGVAGRCGSGSHAGQRRWRARVEALGPKDHRALQQDHRVRQLDGLPILGARRSPGQPAERARRRLVDMWGRAWRTLRAHLSRGARPSSPRAAAPSRRCSWRSCETQMNGRHRGRSLPTRAREDARRLREHARRLRVPQQKGSDLRLAHARRGAQRGPTTLACGTTHTGDIHTLSLILRPCAPPPCWRRRTPRAQRPSSDR